MAMRGLRFFSRLLRDEGELTDACVSRYFALSDRMRRIERRYLERRYLERRYLKGAGSND